MSKLRLSLDREDFLAKYWQRTPLLIPQAIPNFTSPIDADELAGLVLEEEVESRIVEFQNDNWQLHPGPSLHNYDVFLLQAQGQRECRGLRKRRIDSLW